MRRYIPGLALFTLTLLAGDQRLITSTDIYKFHWLADPQISPDGSQIVYTYVSVNAKKDGYDTTLYMIPSAGGAPRQLTAGPRDASPRWSPDGKRLAFVRSGAEREPGQIYVLPLDGGESRQLTELAKGGSSPAWAPDGQSLAFGSTTLGSDADKKKDEEKSDVRVINRAVYRSNGAGYNDPERPSHIWIVKVPAIIDAPQKARQLTMGRFGESDITWSRDGAKLFFTSNRDLEPYYKPQASEAYSIPVGGGEITSVAKVAGGVRNIALDASGSRLSFVAALNGNPVRSHSQADLWVSTIGGGQPKNLTEKFDNDINSGAGGDQSPPRGGASAKPVWSRDGRFVYINAAEQGRGNLKRVDAETGAITDLTTGDHDLYSYSATPDASRFAVAISTTTNIGDLYTLDAASGKLTRLTHINETLFSDLKISEPEMIWYNSFDGKKIQAWVQFPPDRDPSKKYPLILNIHGGPHAAYGYVFDHEFQWMAAKGYAVLYPNPRGSTSYGQDFANVIQYHYPGDDYKDLMAGVDELIKRGWVDASKMGVTGGSGGGVLTNWTIGHTDRFKAAVSQRSIADWRDFWYTADFTLFQATWFRAAPWEDEADFKARSPITFIDKIKTPSMFIEGEADMRTPPGAGGEQMFRALKYRHIPTTMVQFPGETHELSRSGKPKHRVERLEHMVGWFDKYVMGEEIKMYDVQ